jgi:transposase
MAVTRKGIPVRVWTFPGDTSDQAIIRKVRDDLRGWNLARVIWVLDRGFTSERNRRYLQRAGGHYIVGEKLRAASSEATIALQRQGRYHTVEGNLRVKQVCVDDGTDRDRFVICHNPERAVRDRAVREQILARLQEQIAASDKLTAAKRRELYGALQTKPAFKRFLRQTQTGKLRIDRAAVTAERKLDGKFLLRTSDESLTAEDIALGYKALYEAERGWRDLKSTIDLRPVYHRREDRIEAHVQLCWLALLLLRVAETEVADTWRNIRNELDRMHLVTLATSEGTVAQRTELTHRQRQILKALELPEPPRFYDFTPAASTADQPEAL